ncbi:formylglycine-generating enzyme family protein [bacterium]|nr:formylglycine-generating enzyme family protein [bacterium]
MKQIILLLFILSVVQIGHTQTIPTPAPADINHDGIVDQEDLLIIQHNWLQGEKSIISENVLTEINSDLSFLSSSNEDITFLYLSSTQTEIKPGNIIVGVENGGYIRRVTEVITDGQQVIVKTEQASLVDAVQQGSLNETLEDLEWTVIQSNLQKQEVEPGDKLQDIGASLNDLSGIKLYEDESSTVEITSGSINFKPKFNLDIDIASMQVEKFQAEFLGPMELDIDILASLESPLSTTSEVTIAEYETTAVQLIGSVHVVEKISLSLIAGTYIQTDSALTLETGFDSFFDVQMGAEFVNGEWFVDVMKPPILNPHIRDWTASSKSAEAHFYIRPEATIKFYSLSGPKFSLQPYVQFNGEITQEPSCSWVLSGGVDAMLSMDNEGLGILDQTISTLDEQFLIDEQVLARNACEPPLEPTPTPNPDVFTGETITIDLPGLPDGAKQLEMVLIPSGTFTMGSLQGERGRQDNEWLPHEVTISEPFYMSKYEVTQAQWERLMGYNPSFVENQLNYPVEQVSWDDCQVFLDTLTSIGQRQFRLPTEAEWEFACRAGTKTRFSFGDALECGEECELCDVQDQYMWWCANYQNDSREVGSKQPNLWGLFDMHGSVSEWCSDWWEDPVPRGSQTDPQGPITGFKRLSRGGAWINNAIDCRSASRNDRSLDSASIDVGFRIVFTKSAPTPTPVPTPSEFTGETLMIDIPGLPPEAKPLELVLIPSGSFTMGAPFNEQSRSVGDWLPYQVTITEDFYLGKYEVTQAQWEQIMGSNPSGFNRRPNNPVERVTWEECQVFLDNLSNITQLTFRLPSEAEWEYACRAGSETRYSFGDALECSDNCEFCYTMNEYMWWCGNVNETIEVGLKLPNPWGLYDMHGNVWEICSDWYQSPTARGPETNPQGPTSGTNHVTRGGSWSDGANYARSASRAGLTIGFDYIGFRVAASISPNAPTPTPTPGRFTGETISIDLPNMPTDAIPFEMVLIPSGTFTMGSDRNSREQPPHQVTITQPFYIGKYEVTQAQWEAVTGSNPVTLTSIGNDYAIGSVSWDQCQTFIEELNGLGVGTFRLPTEAEWEYACRAETETLYSYGDASECSNACDFCELHDQYMWWCGNNIPSEPKEVGLKMSNPWGLFDMHGNISEWCSDWFEAYSGEPQTNPLGPDSGEERVSRGGHYGLSAVSCRSGFREDYRQNFRASYTGLRLVMTNP